MSDANTRETEYVFIRRNGAAEGETHKGGVWKIAYADFMTAMMAFFLVMWLINATSDTTKTGVANYFNPIKLSDGMQLPKKGLTEPEELTVVSTEPDAKTDPAAEAAAPPEHEAAKDTPTAGATGGATSEAAHGEKRARFTEDALFRDPYAVLAAIAAEAGGNSALGDGGAAGAAAAQESFGDPFDPAAWDTAGPGPGEHAPTPSASAPDSAADSASSRVAAELPETTYDELVAARARASKGEGADVPADPADVEAKRLQQELLQTIRQAVASGSMPNVTVENADGGVLISLADQVDFGMFAIGSAEPLPETIAVMEKIAALLKGMPGEVIIRGHTDGRPFRSEGYDNWRLSAARAYMAYHMLVRGGLDERRVGRIEGYADRDLKLPENPEAAENRRIDILVQHADVRS